MGARTVQPFECGIKDSGSMVKVQQLGIAVTNGGLATQLHSTDMPKNLSINEQEQFKRELQDNRESMLFLSMLFANFHNWK
jgi:hypothetical protein